MDDKFLLKIALVVSVLGIIGLFLVTEIIEIPLQKIEELEEGDYVKIVGEIISINQKDTMTFFQIKDETGKIDVVYFDLVELEEGIELEVEGQVEEYKGKLEIIADSLR